MAVSIFIVNAWKWCDIALLEIYFLQLVHGQVTIIFVVSVCLFVGRETSFLGVTQPPGVAQPLYSRGHN